ncbi:hypothetical protein Rsub_06484 [Raphidocelis subcapitata]|uniref:GPI-anchored wall transfer protein n=1 Tax=Raphidocelis subcapitata TaxID=307507 RepID=A0A2V0P2W6_9CHLO|nr:hypothetical protein Rsub_06484 [Raphidocelis subcapitata]|eukprot:GBF94214.1 hypothetical protein Rsub_06484 [Raphidocelis subcapitata]
MATAAGADAGDAAALRARAAAKEAFVAGLQGTTKWEIFCVIGCLPMCSLFAAAAQSWVLARLRRLGASPRLLRASALAIEAAALIAPQVALTMSPVEAVPIFLMLLLLWVSVALKIWLKMLRGPGARAQLGAIAQHLAEPRKRFVSAFRGATMLLTALAILGVDFPAFPRRYAKAEGHGQGLMDLGVGAVVFSGGLVSKAVDGRGGGRSSALQRAASGLRAALPLLALGFARLVATRAAGYQHPVAEYGVHWNFFFTAAAVALLTLLSQLPPRALLPAGFAVSAAHQAALSLLGGSAWVHSDARGPGWAGLNKEGLGSIPGYWALSLLGAAAGHHLQGSAAAAASRVRTALSATGKRGGGSGGGGGAGSAGGGGVEGASWAVWLWVARLLAADAAAWALLWLLETAVEPVSRRSCNAAYVLWVCAQCFASLAMCAVTDVATVALAAPPRAAPPPGGAAAAAAAPSPRLLCAINRNLLPLFLAANLLTGAVNLGFDTLAASDGVARAIVGAYLVVVCLLAAALGAHGVTLKL